MAIRKCKSDSVLAVVDDSTSCSEGEFSQTISREDASSPLSFKSEEGSTPADAEECARPQQFGGITSFPRPWLGTEITEFEWRECEWLHDSVLVAEQARAPSSHISPCVPTCAEDDFRQPSGGESAVLPRPWLGVETTEFEWPELVFPYDQELLCSTVPAIDAVPLNSSPVGAQSGIANIPLQEAQPPAKPASQARENSDGAAEESEASKRRCRGCRGRKRRFAKIQELDAQDKEAQMQHAHGLKSQLNAGGPQLEDALAAIKGSVHQLSFRSQWHSRVVQLALERLEAGRRREEADALVAEMHGCVLQAIESEHAHHVIQKIVVVSPPATAKFIAQELHPDVPHVAHHRFGGQVVQRLAEHPNSANAAFLDEVTMHAMELSKSGPVSCGHHVMRTLVEHGSHGQRTRIVDILCDNLGALVQSSYARDVMKKVLERSTVCMGCTQEDKERLAKTLLEHRSHIHTMAVGKQGHTLIKAALDVFMVNASEHWLEHARNQLKAVAHDLVSMQKTKHAERLHEVCLQVGLSLK